MNAYHYFHNHPDINSILDTINETLGKAGKNALPSCHGRYHTMFVVEKIGHILQLFACNARFIELGKIAALLHDIGNIAGRKNHARKSAALATVFLAETDLLLPEEKDMIVQAIGDHSDGSSISTAIGAALIIADKADFSKNRILPAENIDAWHRSLLEIEDVDVLVSDNTMTFNYITTGTFSKEVFLSDLRVHDRLTGAAAYFGHGFRMQFNGRDEIS